MARTREDVARCQYAIAEVYNRQYGVVFSEDHHDLEAKIEPWPHRYLMVLHDGVLAATIGLYLRNTYVERFGQVERQEFADMLGAPNTTERYDVSRLREITKLVVQPEFRGQNLARFTLGCGHARAFCQTEAIAPHLITFCSKRSIVEHVYAPTGLCHRLIKPFPMYKVHELYRSPEDPMDSYLMVPEADIPPRWYELSLPGEYDVADLMVSEAAS
ncbi:MAG: GNAT family N-acetyltransferase [Gemmatimonadaceae bacterium]